MSRESGRSALPLLGSTCLFASGFGSLVLEVVWSRCLELVFGSTTLAVSTILVAYMLGLGLGGLFGGRLTARLRRPIRAYGLIEVGVAAYAMVVPFVFDLYPWLNRAVLHPLGFWPSAFLRFLLVLVVLILPTLLMGATLPVLAAGLIRNVKEIGQRVGLLYGLNTLGAVAGTLSATFLLFPRLGLLGTNFAGAGTDLLVGVFTLTVLVRLENRDQAVEPPAAVVRRPAPRYRGRRLWGLVSYGLVGFTGLAYEVAWTRALTMVFGSSVYAFSTMLGAFLTGIALGSLLARRWVDRLRDATAAYALGLCLLGVTAVLTVPLMSLMPHLLLNIFNWMGTSGQTLLVSNVTLSFATMVVPTLMLGALFPLLVRALSDEDGAVAAGIGDVYFVNTVGSALGAFAAGFLLIPFLGLRHSIAFAAALNLVVAAVTLWLSSWGSVKQRRALAVAPVALAIAVLAAPPRWDRNLLDQGVYQRPWRHIELGRPRVPMPEIEEDELLFYEEGLNTTVSVHRTPDGIDMRVNGKTDASELDMSTQVLSGHLPILFGGTPGDVAVIGYASGVTTGAVSLYRPERLDVVEIEPAIIEASKHFEPLNHSPLDEPFVNVIMDDGRNYLGGTSRKYDVIISEPSNPWLSGCSNLFTEEFFEIARSRLKDEGRLLQWIQLYGMAPDGLRSVLAAMTSTFPHVYGFLDNLNHTDLLLIATDRPLRCGDLPRWESLAEPVKHDLIRVGVDSTAELWSLMVLSPEDVEQLARRSEVRNTDDSMYVELSAPLHVYRGGEHNLDLIAKAGRGLVPMLSSAEDCVPPRLIGETAVSHHEYRGNPALASALAQVALDLGDGTHPPLVQTLRAARAEPQQLDRAIAQAERIVRFDPEAFEVRFQTARLHQRARRWDQALRHAERAVQLRPDHLPARALRMRALAATRHLREAHAEAQLLLETPLRHHDFRLVADAGVLSDAAGDHDRAASLLEEFVRRRPYAPRQWQMLALARERAGRSDQARLAREQKELAEENIERMMERRALLAERLGYADQAQRILADLGRMFPDEVDTSRGSDASR